MYEQSKVCILELTCRARSPEGIASWTHSENVRYVIPEWLSLSSDRIWTCDTNVVFGPPILTILLLYLHFRGPKTGVTDGRTNERTNGRTNTHTWFCLGSLHNMPFGQKSRGNLNKGFPRNRIMGRLKIELLPYSFHLGDLELPPKVVFVTVGCRQEVSFGLRYQGYIWGLTPLFWRCQWYASRIQL